MTLAYMFDASVPPADPVPGFSAVAGYIGGSTPHVWTLDEWRRFARLYQFPIWVAAGRGDSASQGNQDAGRAVGLMESLGWARDRPDRRALIVDVEALAMPAYLDGFSSYIWASGYETIIYESGSVVADNPVKEGIWLADWNGTPDLPGPAAVLAHQYRADVLYQGTEVDWSVISPALLAHGGQGPRKG